MMRCALANDSFGLLKLGGNDFVMLI